MKKVFFLIASICLATNALAQQKISWEAQGGLNVSSISNDPTSSHLGFNLGLRRTRYFSPSTNGAYYNVGAQLTSKGASKGTKFVSIYYLEVPVHCGYEFSIEENTNAFVEVGPYVAYGLLGSNNFLEDTNVFEKANRLDAGLGGRVGISFKRCSVSLGYDLGLLTLDKKGSRSIYNRNLHFSIGYRF